MRLGRFSASRGGGVAQHRPTESPLSGRLDECGLVWPDRFGALRSPPIREESSVERPPPRTTAPVKSNAWFPISALFWAVALIACGPPAPPNLVLITLDTTRWDHLGVYGYGAGTTPSLDRFAESAVIYERAYATSSWTLPSHASIFTGLLPMEHGAQSAAGGTNRSLNYNVRPLQESFTTLAEALRESGYQTGAVVGGPALRRELGIDQGFQVYDDDFSNPRSPVHGRPAAEIGDAALALIERFGEGPYFLFVNFFDPHAPYHPPSPHDRGLANPGEIERGDSLVMNLLNREPARLVSELPAAEGRWLERLRAGYDAEIRYMDLHLGRLLDAIADGPRGDETLIAITADHGESFGEHYYLSHGAHLYEDNVRVPLLVRHPAGNGATRVSGPVQNLRLFQTLLDAAGVRLPDGIDPRGLADDPGEIVLQVQRSDLNVRMLGEFFDRDTTALASWPFKLIARSNGTTELYDLSRDPEELHDLATAEPDRLRQLQDRLSRLEASRKARYSEDSRAELRPETEEALRALGYAQ
jgi:arylsulfatase A-like enzyme